MTAIRHPLCEGRAMLISANSMLILMDNRREVALQHGCTDGQNCPYRQILPGRLRPINQYEAKLAHNRG
jgi:hypothetical protein